MKAKHLWLVSLIFIIGCEKPIDEVPLNISIITPPSDLADSLLVLLPPSSNAVVAHPDLFSDNNNMQIVLKEESEVYITFIDEGAIYRNSLCWYTYKSGEAPQKSSSVDVHTAFPNISKKDEGGELEAGFTVQLGASKFLAGTVIGFALIVNGWDDGVILYDNLTFYSDKGLNYKDMQQHLLFKDKKSKYILVGFEDMNRGDNISDCDFNDIIFSVTDNNQGYEATAFDLSRIPMK